MGRCIESTVWADCIAVNRPVAPWSDFLKFASSDVLNLLVSHLIEQFRTCVDGDACPRTLGRDAKPGSEPGDDEDEEEEDAEAEEASEGRMHREIGSYRRFILHQLSCLVRMATSQMTISTCDKIVGFLIAHGFFSCISLIGSEELDDLDFEDSDACEDEGAGEEGDESDTTVTDSDEGEGNEDEGDASQGDAEGPAAVVHGVDVDVDVMGVSVLVAPTVEVSAQTRYDAQIVLGQIIPFLDRLVDSGLVRGDGDSWCTRAVRVLQYLVGVAHGCATSDKQLVLLVPETAVVAAWVRTVGADLGELKCEMDGEQETKDSDGVIARSVESTIVCGANRVLVAVNAAESVLDNTFRLAVAVFDAVHGSCQGKANASTAGFLFELKVMVERIRRASTSGERMLHVSFLRVASSIIHTTVQKKEEEDEGASSGDEMSDSEEDDVPDLGYLSVDDELVEAAEEASVLCCDVAMCISDVLERLFSGLLVRSVRCLVDKGMKFKAVVKMLTACIGGRHQV